MKLGRGTETTLSPKRKMITNRIFFGVFTFEALLCFAGNYELKRLKMLNRDFPPHLSSPQKTPQNVIKE